MPLIKINDYLDHIANDFSAYLDEGHELCDLRALTYAKNRVPDYSDIHMQQYYLLRYAYGYAFEYKFIYSNFFKYFAPPSNRPLHITSIGCGTMLDYWALVRALRSIGRKDVQIHYTGFDLVDWNYQMPARKKDSVNFIQADVIQELASQASLDSDIYFFPKSISEFRGDNLNRLCDAFRNKPAAWSGTFFLFSIRTNEYYQKQDAGSICKLWNAMEESGYSLIDTPLQKGDGRTRPTNTWYHSDKKMTIASLDQDFSNPRRCIDLVDKLYTRCSRYKKDGAVCPDEDCDESLDRSPILNNTEVRYVILPFTRS